MPSLVVQAIESISGFRALEAEWRGLFASSDPLLPFSTFDWADCWWEHFAQQGLLRADHLYVCVVRDVTGEVLGIAPLMETHRPGVGPVKSRALQFFGADRNLTEIRTVLCAPNRQREVFRALLDHVSQRKDDWIHWAAVPDSCMDDLHAAPGLLFDREIPDYILPLPESWDAFQKSLKRNVKESLRKCYNSLKRDNLSFEFEVITEPREVRQACGDLIRLHGLRADQNAATKHANVFATVASQKFLIDLTHRFARQNILRVFALRIGNERVAMRMGFQFDRSLYLYYSGYLPEFSKYSVMTTTVAESLKWAIANGVTSVNLSTGTDVSKTRWGPEMHAYQAVVVRPPQLRARLAFQAFKYARLIGLHPRIRHLVRR